MSHDQDIFKYENIFKAFVKLRASYFKDENMLDKLIHNLHEVDMLDDFTILFTSLAEGYFDPKNITFLLCLEQCKFETKKTTAQMWYQDKTKLFWSLLRAETFGHAVYFAGGPKNKGNVVNKVIAKGHYDPTKAKANFAIPLEKILAKTIKQSHSTGNRIPGIIQESIDLLSEGGDIILMGDGKGLAQGQLPGGRGDMDLFGHEDTPMKKQLQKVLDDLLTSVE